MRSTTRCCRALPQRPFHNPLSFYARRCLHTTPHTPATPIPQPVVPGPPPAPPKPAATFPEERVAQKRKKADLLKLGQQLKADSGNHKPGTALQRRFWRDVSVKTNEDGSHTILLDSRPVRTPSKSALTIPASKPHLATAIALEWDALTSAWQATKHTYIPLTSLAARAHDIAAADANNDTTMRSNVVDMLMGYLRTDTLLCWAPETSIHDPVPEALDSSTEAAAARFKSQTPHAASSSSASPSPAHDTLRSRQIAAATPILDYLIAHIWPGVAINPVLEESSIRPTPQPEITTQVIRGWLMGLGAWELAAVERASLASKSLCVAVRLVVEWSAAWREQGRGAGTGRERGSGNGDAGHGRRDSAVGDEVMLNDSVSGWTDGGTPSVDTQSTYTDATAGGGFGVEEAAAACTQEVAWQTAMWGEVEDTHDVEKEDLRSQLGSVVLLVS